MKEKIDKYLLKSIFVVVLIFIVSYVIFPYVIPTEYAIKCNIKKFQRNKELFNNVIDACWKTHEQTSKSHIVFDDIPFKIQNKLRKQGITQLQANVHEKNKIVVEFYITKFWYVNTLNHVTLVYNSDEEFEPCEENNLNAWIATICLGNGWFFEIDFDWL